MSEPSTSGGPSAGASGADWGEGGGNAPKKRRIPRWVWWGCGGGCLVMTLALVAAAIFFSRIVREGMDEEKQWPRLQEVLAYEQRPANIEIEMGLSIGADQFRLVDRSKGRSATVIEYPSAGSSEYKQLLDPDFKLPMGIAQPVDPEAGTLTVQGREVACLRFSRIKPERAGQGMGPGIRVDLTGEHGKPRTLELRIREGTRVEDADVETFLAPFQVWKER